jgi:hypothetical protein
MQTRSSSSFSSSIPEHERFREANSAWIAQYEPLFTHALTLTFNHTQMRRRIMSLDSSLVLNDDALVSIYKASMRMFKWRLARSLYGNAWKRYGKRFVFIPILEGLKGGQKPHYHCMLGVTEDRIEKVAEKVLSIWREVPFGGTRIDVKRYRDRGWIDYSTKNVLKMRGDGIDWDNVVVSKCVPATE